MIGKQDILDRAAEWQLRPSVVEKDYVLGWLLAAIAEHPEGSQQWIFKGGTCLKKCFFETYRFSEDLDFSLLPGARYTTDDLQNVLREVAARAAEMSGLQLPPELATVRERKNLQGGLTFEGRIGYRGPMADPTFPRVRFDLTRHEPVLDGVARRGVFHAYPDELPEGLALATYTIDELFAEKVRALAERTRPRDLYDVIFMLENQPDALDLSRSRTLFREKCGVKNLPAPTSSLLLDTIRGSAEIRSEWANMLAHQLPQLPPIDSLLARAAGLFEWLESEATAARQDLASVAAPAPDEQIVAAAGLKYWGAGVGLEAVRFAGTNRLLIEFSYHGQLRRVEPYSLRRAQTGNLLLYAWELASKKVKAFNVAKMSGLRATSAPFTPRYRVEFAATAPMSAPPIFIQRSSGTTRAGLVPRIGPRIKAGPRIQRTAGSGPTYVYRCTVCGRTFRRKSMNGSLNEHKNRSGYPCFGRYGVYVRTQY